MQAAVRRPIRRRLALTVLGFGAFAAGVCTAAPFIGSADISLGRVFDRSIPFEQNVDAQIFFLARLPRVAAGAIAGATLAAAGVVFQAMLRNPLATPFTLGVSAGASLGAMLAITFGAALTAGPFSSVPFAALAGAAAAALIVYRLAAPYGRAMSTSVLLLAGVTLNSFLSALIMFVQYIADFAQVYRAARWLMGDLDVGGFAPNFELSKKRADAVVAQLVSQYKVDAKRLQSFGVSYASPVAPNVDDAGRARNRRVELVANN